MRAPFQRVFPSGSLIGALSGIIRIIKHPTPAGNCELYPRFGPFHCACDPRFFADSVITRRFSPPLKHRDRAIVFALTTRAV